MAIPAFLTSHALPFMGALPIDRDIQNVSQATQNAYKSIWGSTMGEAAQHLKEKTDLREVHAGDKVYDLADPEQLEMYLKDMGDGCLDGEMNERSVDIYVKDGKVTVTKDDGGEAIYNLADPADVLKMQKDSADGRIDGRINKKPNRAASGNTENASGSEGTGAGQKPGGKDGAGSADNPQATGSDEGHDVTTSESGKKPADAGGASGEAKGADGKSKSEHAKEAVAYAEKRGPEGLMQDIRNGNLPASIMESPEAMAVINQRIMDYQTMVTMMSNMMKMMHDLQMTLANNMR
jgi:hypothetical protein